MITRKRLYLILILGALFVIVAALPREIQQQKYLSNSPERGTARPYSVISQKDISVIDRSRFEWRIVAPEANSFEDRALTAMKAAEELRQKKMIQVARIFLEPDQESAGQGLALAIAVYSIDGRGFSGVEGKRWEVEATGDKPSQYVPTRLKYKNE